MDFNTLNQIYEGQVYTPYAGKVDNGDWIEGTLSVDFLILNFGGFTTPAEMIAATDSDGLKLFFGWLVDQGILH